MTSTSGTIAAALHRARTLTALQGEQASLATNQAQYMQLAKSSFSMLAGGITVATLQAGPVLDALANQLTTGSLAAPPRNQTSRGVRMTAPANCLSATKKRRWRRKGGGGDAGEDDYGGPPYGGGDDWGGGGGDWGGWDGDCGDGGFGRAVGDLLWLWKTLCLVSVLQTVQFLSQVQGYSKEAPTLAAACSLAGSTTYPVAAL